MLPELLRDRLLAIAQRKGWAIPAALLVFVGVSWCLWDLIQTASTLAWLYSLLPDSWKRAPRMSVNVWHSLPFWMFISGLAWLGILAFIPRRKQSPPQTLALPEVRPLVTAVRYGRSPDNRAGLFIKNEHDTIAYNISVTRKVPIGQSTLEFWTEGVPRLEKAEGEHLIQASIERPDKASLIGSDLRHEMVQQGIDHILLIIRYEDSENRQYITHCAIEKGFLGNGLVVTFVKQELEPALSAQDPQILLEYRWRDSGEYGYRDRGDMPVVVRNSGRDTAINVQISEIAVGKWKVRFPLIPHLDANASAKLTALIEYDEMSIESVQGYLISVLKPAANGGYKESQITAVTTSYGNARGDRFLGEYQFKWDHNTRECIATLKRLRKVSATSAG